MAHQLGGERIVVGEERRQVGAERDARRAGQRGEVDDQLRLVLVGERQRVGENEPALGVGVADLDGQALARRVDVARPERGAGNRVLDRRNEHAQPDFQPARP